MHPVTLNIGPLLPRDNFYLRLKWPRPYVNIFFILDIDDSNHRSIKTPTRTHFPNSGKEIYPETYLLVEPRLTEGSGNSQCSMSTSLPCGGERRCSAPVIFDEKDLAHSRTSLWWGRLLDTPPPRPTSGLGIADGLMIRHPGQARSQIRVLTRHPGQERSERVIAEPGPRGQRSEIGKSLDPGSSPGMTETLSAMAEMLSGMTNEIPGLVHEKYEYKNRTTHTRHSGRVLCHRQHEIRNLLCDLSGNTERQIPAFAGMTNWKNEFETRNEETRVLVVNAQEQGFAYTGFTSFPRGFFPILRRFHDCNRLAGTLSPPPIFNIPAHRTPSRAGLYPGGPKHYRFPVARPLSAYRVQVLLRPASGERRPFSSNSNVNPVHSDIFSFCVLYVLLLISLIPYLCKGKGVRVNRRVQAHPKFEPLHLKIRSALP